MASRRGVNLRTTLERIIVLAGLEPWPRLLQNLRASCATDWVEMYPAHVVARWLGHSPKVAAQNYLMSRDHHFEHVVTGGGAGGRLPEPGQGGLRECDANCDSIATRNATRNATPNAPASASEQPQKKTEPAVTTRVTAGSAVIAPVSETGLVAGTGSEQSVFSSGKPGAAAVCDAKCDAISEDRTELLARAVVMVAQMQLRDDERQAVLERVVGALGGLASPAE